MKACIIGFFFITISVNAIAQNTRIIPNQSIQIDVGIGKHGTGDLSGFVINSEYKKYFRRKLSFSLGLGATINDGALPILYSDLSGNLVDASYRYNTAGLQLTSKLGLSFVRNTKNDFGLQIGVMLRYQSSSYYDEVTVLYPPITGLAVPVVTIINESPQRTVAAGGIAQLYYHYAVKENIYIGSSIALQTDTNGDFIRQLTLTCGLKF